MRFSCELQSLASQDREGAGVRGMGCRGALLTARELRGAGSGDSLAALRRMITGSHVDDTPASQVARAGSKCHGCKRCGHGDVLKKVHGKKGCVQCGTSEGCLPRLEEGAVCECSHCQSVATAGGNEKVQVARVLQRAESRTSEEPGCLDGFDAVVRQYSRRADHISVIAFNTIVYM